MLLPAGGGEEFVILLPHTSCEEAAALAERIRIGYEELSGISIPITLSASFGVVQAKETEDADTLIRRADKALYCAKHEGRNRVVVG